MWRTSCIVMDTSVVTTAVDYTEQLTKIIELLTKINEGTQAIYSMFYIFLVVGFTILLCILFYKFIKIFI